MKKIFSYLRYSGIWIGFVLNPLHWQIAWARGSKEWPNDYLFENCLYIGPIYIRVIIDDGRW
jgi:hypothetical protein